LERIHAAPVLHKSQSELYRDASVMKRHGMNTGEIEEVLRARFRGYYRPITDREFEQAVRNADGTSAASCRRPSRNEHRIDVILRDSGTVEDLSRSSPLGAPEGLTTGVVLDRLFPPEALLCLGTAKDRATTEPREFFRGREDQYQFLVPNPMAAKVGRTKDGRPSVRCLDNTGPVVYQVIEFDFGTLDEQVRLIRHLQNFGIGLRMVVFSGNKSLHAWFEVPNWTPAALDNFRNYAALIGADTATFSACQFVRTPNATRDNGVLQKVLFLQ
jgi:hypothetical protein